MAVHVPALRGPDVWHGRFGPALALVLVVVPLAAAVAWATMLPRFDEAAVDGIRETAGLISDHAAAMVRVGNNIAVAAKTSSVPDRAAWLAYGEHMVTDGRILEALGERLRKTATVAEADPMHGGSAGLAVAVLHARWAQLRADGRATAEHGRVMVLHVGGRERDDPALDPLLLRVRLAGPPRQLRLLRQRGPRRWLALARYARPRLRDLRRDHA